MSHRPFSPLEPDVFSLLPPPLPLSDLVETRRMSGESPPWIPVSWKQQQQQVRGLETVEEQSESGNRYPLADAIQPREMAFSLPATPPLSPEPSPPSLGIHSHSHDHQNRLSPHSRTHRPAQLNLSDLPRTTSVTVAKEKDTFHLRRPTLYSSLSAATPSFNPIVGASPSFVYNNGSGNGNGNGNGYHANTSSPTTTPTNKSPRHPRVSHLRSGSSKDQHQSQQRGFASLPSTPLRSLDRFSTSHNTGNGDDADVRGSSGWTWPLKSANSVLLERAEALRLEMEAQQRSPTKRAGGTTTVGKGMVGEEEGRELATRYVLVEGVERGSTEEDLRELLVSRCKGLSLRGCFTSALRTHGVVVLVFNDVRHALAAVRFLSPSNGEEDAYLRQQSSEALLDARCIARETFEELHTGPLPCPLLSRSEAVLVFTLRGPTSTPYFTPLPLLATFGEVRSLKLVEEHLHVVEYWDDRSAETAGQVLNGRETGGARIGCSFEPGVASVDAASIEPLAFGQAPIAPVQNVSSSPSPFTATTRPFDPPSYPIAFNSTSAPASPAFAPFSTVVRSDSSFSFGFEREQQTREDNSFYAVSESNGNGAENGGGLSGCSTTVDERSKPYISTYPVTASTSPSSPVSPFFAVVSASPLSPSSANHSPHSPAASASPRSATFPPTTASHHKAHGSGGGRNGHGKHRSKLSEEYGIVRDDKIPVGNVLNFERIENGLDMRTTLMLKNIPNKLKDWEVMAFIEDVVGHAFDFFYLRCDYSNSCNVGYGFVNFTSTSALLTFAKARLGTRWNMCGSDKLCIMSFANIQGKASLITHFKNSSVLDQDESRRPKLFITSGPYAGQPEPFPACDDPIRKARSAANAQNVGLFPSQKPVFKITQAFKAMNV